MIDDLGIYTNIYDTGRKAKDGHRIYSATCKNCGTVVEKPLFDLKRNNTYCRHKNNTNISNKVNDMPAGWITTNSLNDRIYHMWKAMWARTTQKYWDKYPTYIGTTVDESWRYLSNFVNDIKALSGYDQWAIAENRSMMFDKDTLVEGNKHYSKDTCCFISHADSNRDVHRRNPDSIQKANRVFVETHSDAIKLTHKKTGEVKQFPSIKAACRELDLNARNVHMVLSDKYPNNHSTKGWLIEYI